MIPPLPSLLASSLLALLPAAQDAARPETNPVVPVEELVIGDFTPERASAQELEPLARELFGRQIVVREASAPPHAVWNLWRLDERIVAYDRPADVARILARLAELDAGAPREPEPALASAQVRPRFVHLDALERLLRASRRKVRWEGELAESYVLFPEQNAALLRETPERLRELLAAIAAIDVPPPRLRLRMQLLARAPEGAAGDALEPALLDALRALAPGASFQRIGAAVLESAVLPDTVLEARLGARHEVELLPQAWDAETGTLSTRRCGLDLSGPEGAEQQFRTSVVLHAGRPTVLAAGGALPVYLVLEIEPLG